MCTSLRHFPDVFDLGLLFSTHFTTSHRFSLWCNILHPTMATIYSHDGNLHQSLGNGKIFVNSFLLNFIWNAYLTVSVVYKSDLQGVITTVSYPKFQRRWFHNHLDCESSSSLRKNEIGLLLLFSCTENGEREMYSIKRYIDVCLIYYVKIVCQWEEYVRIQSI